MLAISDPAGSPGTFRTIERQMDASHFAIGGTLQQYSLLLIDVCGLKSKLKAPDFEETISHDNMIVFTGTKLDDLDSIHINNFKLINNNRKYRLPVEFLSLSITLFLVTSPR